MMKAAEPLKEDVDSIIFMGLCHYRNPVGSTSAFIKVAEI